MNKKFEKFVIENNSTILDAAYKIVKNTERTLIVKRKNKVLGVISSGDILRIILKKKNTFMSIENYYKKNFKYLTKKDFKKAFDLYKKFNISLIPIVDKNFNIKDIISSKDIIKNSKFFK